MTGLPTVEEATVLPVDELAFRILRFFEDLPDEDNWIARRGIGNRAHWVEDAGDRERGLVAADRATEAWDWLVHHGLVAPRSQATNLATEPGYITLRGRAVLADERGLATMQAEDRLNVDLHPRLVTVGIRSLYLLAKHESAAFEAMKAVEIRVRELGGYGNEVFGTDLMRKAFHAVDGPLTDPAQIGGEKDGTSNLFAGAISVFKNPSSHRQVDFDDPTVAVGITSANALPPNAAAASSGKCDEIVPRFRVSQRITGSAANAETRVSNALPSSPSATDENRSTLGGRRPTPDPAEAAIRVVKTILEAAPIHLSREESHCPTVRECPLSGALSLFGGGLVCCAGWVGGEAGNERAEGECDGRDNEE